MHLRKITLNNFRCFKNLELRLHPRLTVLVADNGGGKTALLDGIAVGLSPCLRYFSSAHQRLSGPGIQDIDFRVKKVARNGRVILGGTTRIEMESDQGLRWDVWRASTKGKQPSEKTGQKALADFAARVMESLESDTPRFLPVFTYYGARRGWLPIPKRLRGTSIDYTQPTSALLDTLDPLNDFKEMLNWFDLEEANELRANKGCRPEDFAPSEQLEAVRAAIESILGGKYRNPHFNRQHKFVVDTEESPGQLQISQLSQGYQAMLALAMDFARRLAIAGSHLTHENIMEFPHVQLFLEKLREQDPEDRRLDFKAPALLAPAIMLVDEIDLHLHPSWQQRVLDDLMRAFPCTQFIVTTHSPQVLTTLRRENIRLLEMADNGFWSARQPDFSPLAHEPADALAFIMNTHPKPDIQPVTEHIHAYEQLARKGLANSREAADILQKLQESGYEFNEADSRLFNYLAGNGAGRGERVDD